MVQPPIAPTGDEGEDILAFEHFPGIVVEK